MKLVNMDYPSFKPIIHYLEKTLCDPILRSFQVTQNYASETHVSSVRRFLSEKRDQVGPQAEQICGATGPGR